MRTVQELPGVIFLNPRQLPLRYLPLENLVGLQAIAGIMGGMHVTFSFSNAKPIPVEMYALIVGVAEQMQTMLCSHVKTTCVNLSPKNNIHLDELRYVFLVGEVW